MSPRTCLILGVLCLLLAQGLASGILINQRAALVPNRDVYGALKPGEFAGTLMLGGFRGLACDLLWMRAQNAKEHDHFYESVALADSITKIQPRFEQIWEYMAWDMAYNIAHEVEDDGGQWAWFLAGLEVNVRGILRNTQGERLVRHLAWMFHHKGDEFRTRIESTSWAELINPVLRQINDEVPAERRLALLPGRPGMGNYEISERLYQAAIRAAEANHLRVIPYVRRMVPIAIERDGNRLRNRGEHLKALARYVDALRTWDELLAWNRKSAFGQDTHLDRETSTDIAEHNEGHLLRKTELLAMQLAEDPVLAKQVVADIAARKFDAVTTALGGPGWHTSATQSKLRWLDEE
jgi:tetratricopeptide (TPR) repeat protein